MKLYYLMSNFICSKNIEVRMTMRMQQNTKQVLFDKINFSCSLVFDWKRKVNILRYTSVDLKSKAVRDIRSYIKKHQTRSQFGKDNSRSFKSHLDCLRSIEDSRSNGEMAKETPEFSIYRVQTNKHSTTLTLGVQSGHCTVSNVQALINDGIFLLLEILDKEI